MKKSTYLYIVSLVTAGMMASCTSEVKESVPVTLNVSEKGAPVSPSMYGVFFEEINHAGDGGLYAELVQNRSFEEKEMPEGYFVEHGRLKPAPVPNHENGRVNHDASYKWNNEPVRAWSLQPADESIASMRLTKEQPMFESAPNNLEVSIHQADKPVQLINEGYWGMNIEKGKLYTLRVIIRKDAGYEGSVKAKLLSKSGEVIGEANIRTGKSDEWYDDLKVFEPTESDNEARLALEFDAPGKVWLDYVSLFPPTFNARYNGMRQDVAQCLADLKPAFFRWPGGCVVEGISLPNRFDWKKTLGDPAARPGEYSTWGYRCSYGMGYHEVLQFCEDIGAKMMFVCNVGLGCQFRMGDACSEEEIATYLDDCMDAIEYAIGDVNTEWGALRAKHGHVLPFPLQYVEIGNENWGAEYDRRFDLFYKAIKEKYPQLTLIYNDMTGLSNENRAIEKTDMIDPHWYVAPDFFYRNTTLFDTKQRGKWHVYVGEYACNQGVGGGNMNAALSEAAFISGMERNGDLVTMTSYAPLFENVNNREWPTNLIWIDTDQVMGRTSYHVQKMYAENRPTYNIYSSATILMPDSMVTAQDSIPQKFLASGYDEKTGEIIIKFINSADKAQTIDFTLEGVANVLPEGRAITLQADDLGDENSMDNPNKIVPVEKPFKKFGQTFSYNFPKYSFTILRVKAEK